MSTDTPRPERVTLSAEEHALGMREADCGCCFIVDMTGFWEVLAAREQALREEIAGEIDRAAMILDRSAEWRDGMDEAANIIRGETR